MTISDPAWPNAGDWLRQEPSEPALVVMGVPTAVSSLSPSQADTTPARFREMLGKFAQYHGEEAVDLRGLDALDRGDLEVGGPDAASSLETMTAAAAGLEPGPVYAFIGGDNAITRPLVRGVAAGDLSKVGVLTFDAHHDVRSLDRGPSNGNPIRGLFADGLPRGHVSQIGIHTFANSAEYRRYCEKQGVAIFTMSDVEADGIAAVVQRALAHLERRCERIYVDFDIDVLDRAYAVACPGARPGGMTPRQLQRGAFECGLHPAVTAADFVEVDAAADRDDITVMNLITAFLSFAAGLTIRGGRP